ncbi:SAM-dependent methyltransferase [Emcibacter sp. SYSU 3D8]|uniref:SAM-dependent methyltransferase n=1 Tax=Emcibacter sp. SYSU 3D8 TaxID=3133969 RepID=UPI0031FF271B
MNRITLEPIGTVRNERTEPIDDGWDAVESRIVLDGRFGADALAGLGAFSHIEVLFAFHLVSDEKVNTGARHPRGREDWPEVGIFAQRGKDRPNRLGLCTCPLIRVQGTALTVRGLDAIDGTPVLDIKPWMKGFAPRGEIREPDWAAEIMRDYW